MILYLYSSISLLNIIMEYRILCETKSATGRPELGLDWQAMLSRMSLDEMVGSVVSTLEEDVAWECDIDAIVNVLEEVWELKSVDELGEVLFPATASKSAERTQESKDLKDELIEVSNIEFVQELEQKLAKMLEVAKVAAEKKAMAEEEAMQKAEALAAKQAEAEAKRAAKVEAAEAKQQEKLQRRVSKLEAKIAAKAAQAALKSAAQAETGSSSGSAGDPSSLSSSISSRRLQRAEERRRRRQGDDDGDDETEYYAIGDGDGSVAAALSRQAADDISEREMQEAKEEHKRFNKWLKIAKRPPVIIEEYLAFRDFSDFVDAPLDAGLEPEEYLAGYTYWTGTSDYVKYVKARLASLQERLRAAKLGGADGPSEVQEEAAVLAKWLAERGPSNSRVVALANKAEWIWLDRFTRAAGAAESEATDDGEGGGASGPAAAAVDPAVDPARLRFNRRLEASKRTPMSPRSWSHFQACLRFKAEQAHDEWAVEEHLKRLQKRMDGAKGLKMYDDWLAARERVNTTLTVATATSLLEPVRESIRGLGGVFEVVKAADCEVVVEYRGPEKSKTLAQVGIEATLMDSHLGIDSVIFRYAGQRKV